MWRFPKLDASTPRLTREGYYYVGVLLFVISGAVAKQLNLLVLLCGMLVAPLVLHLRLVSSSLRGLRLSRRVPQRAFVGQPVYVQLGVKNPRRKIPSWLVIARDTIRRDEARGRAASTVVPVQFPWIAPADEVWTSYRLCLTRRGRYFLGPARLTTRFPLGLFHASRRVGQRDTLIVAPRLGHLTPAWTQQLRGEQAGSQETVSRRGLTEAEFYGLREWRAGDSRRWIHWRTSARIGNLAVRQFERQRQADVGVLLDLWLPDEPTEQQLLNLEHAISFTATVVQQLAHEQNTRLSLIVAGATTHRWTAVVSSTLLDEILQQLALVHGSENSGADCSAQLLAAMPQRGRRFVISSRPEPAAASAATNGKSNGRANGEVLSPTTGAVTWMDVSSPSIEQYFTFAEKTVAPRRPNARKESSVAAANAEEMTDGRE